MWTKPHSDAGAPAVTRAVLRRLERLDPSLHVSWHLNSIDLETGRVILTRYGIIDATTGISTPGNSPVRNPLYHLWRKDDSDSQWHFVATSTSFGDRQVRALEADIARRVSHNKLAQHMHEKMEERKALDQVANDAERRGRIVANKSLNHDILFNGKRPYRRAKLFSGGGVMKRSDAGIVRIDRREFLGTADEDEDRE